MPSLSGTCGMTPNDPQQRRHKRHYCPAATFSATDPIHYSGVERCPHCIHPNPFVELG